MARDAEGGRGRPSSDAEQDIALAARDIQLGADPRHVVARVSVARSARPVFLAAIFPETPVPARAVGAPPRPRSVRPPRASCDDAPSESACALIDVVCERGVCYGGHNSVSIDRLVPRGEFRADRESPRPAHSRGAWDAPSARGAHRGTSHHRAHVRATRLPRSDARGGVRVVRPRRPRDHRPPRDPRGFRFRRRPHRPAAPSKPPPRPPPRRCRRHRRRRRARIQRWGQRRRSRRRRRAATSRATRAGGVLGRGNRARRARRQRPRGRPGGRGKRSTSTGKRPGASLGYHRVHVRPPPPRPSGRRPPEDAPRAGRPRARDRVRVGVRVETSAAAHLPRPPWVAAHLPRPPRGSSPPRENHPPSRRRPINTDNSSRDTCPKRLRLRPFLRLSRRRRRRPVVRPSPTVPPSRSATC